jgi:S-adenosylmethionine:tRNA ribosyltransferase-isomerase
VQRSDFHYELPAGLIAQSPLPGRGDSRLLVLDGADGAISDRTFAALPSLLVPGDLLVLNDTRVVPARLYGQKSSGGRVEVLLERTIDERRVLVQLKASHPPRAEQSLSLEGGATAIVRRRHDDLYELELDRPALAYFEACGHVPLPPYIDRPDAADDRLRYQTVFARTPGAVAAPTAGLHFDADMLKILAGSGVEQTFVTLHVGAGTFQPVRTDDVRSHRLHAERATVSAEASAAIDRARARGSRVIAVGTTVVRTLEAAATDDVVSPFDGETSLFIYPGFGFRVVDGMITNFHLPESSLLMLVCAFAGTDAVLSAYRHAVAQRYRFYSYGDAMFVTSSQAARR